MMASNRCEFAPLSISKRRSKTLQKSEHNSEQSPERSIKQGSVQDISNTQELDQHEQIYRRIQFEKKLQQQPQQQLIRLQNDELCHKIDIGQEQRSPRIPHSNSQPLGGMHENERTQSSLHDLSRQRKCDFRNGLYMYGQLPTQLSGIASSDQQLSLEPSKILVSSRTSLDFMNDKSVPPSDQEMGTNCSDEFWQFIANTKKSNDLSYNINENQHYPNSKVRSANSSPRMANLKSTANEECITAGTGGSDGPQTLLSSKRLSTSTMSSASPPLPSMSLLSTRTLPADALNSNDHNANPIGGPKTGYMNSNIPCNDNTKRLSYELPFPAIERLSIYDVLSPLIDADISDTFSMTFSSPTCSTATELSSIDDCLSNSMLPVERSDSPFSLSDANHSESRTKPNGRNESEKPSAMPLDTGNDKIESINEISKSQATDHSAMGASFFSDGSNFQFFNPQTLGEHVAGVTSLCSVVSKQPQLPVHVRERSTQIGYKPVDLSLNQSFEAYQSYSHNPSRAQIATFTQCTPKLIAEKLESMKKKLTKPLPPEPHDVERVIRSRMRGFRTASEPIMNSQEIEKALSPSEASLSNMIGSSPQSKRAKLEALVHEKDAIISELVTSEGAFIHELKSIVLSINLSEASPANSFYNAILKLYGILESMRKLHVKLHKNLLTSEDVVSCLYNAFPSFFPVYLQYLVLLPSIPIMKIPVATNYSNSLPIQMRLLSPFQRILRYPLLVQRIAKILERLKHFNASGLQSCERFMKRANEYIRALEKHKDEEEQILRLRKIMFAAGPGSYPLLGPDTSSNDSMSWPLTSGSYVNPSIGTHSFRLLRRIVFQGRVHMRHATSSEKSLSPRRIKKSKLKPIADYCVLCDDGIVVWGKVTTHSDSNSSLLHWLSNTLIFDGNGGRGNSSNTARRSVIDNGIEWSILAPIERVIQLENCSKGEKSVTIWCRKAGSNQIATRALEVRAIEKSYMTGNSWVELWQSVFHR